MESLEAEAFYERVKAEALSVMSSANYLEDAGLWADVEALLAPSMGAIENATLLARTTLAPVTDDDTLKVANDHLRLLATVTRQLETARKDATTPVLRQKATVDGIFKGAMDALSKGQLDTNQAMRAYQDEQRRKREAAEAKARKEADQERLRKERLAAKALADGNMERAIRHQEAAAAVQARPVDLPPPPKTEGTFDRTTWHAEVTNPGLLPREYLVPDMAKLNNVAKAMKGDFSVAGAKAVSSSNTVARSI